MSVENLRALEQAIEKHFPEFEVRFKDESKFMRVLGLLMHPFNSGFMTHFTTTLGSTVYFPSRARYEAEAGTSFVTLSHELVHIYDSREAGVHFQFSYASPQIWALPLLAVYFIFGGALPLCALLAGYVYLAVTCQDKRRHVFWALLGAVVLTVLVLSVSMAGWWTLALLGAVACLAPWSSSGRTYWEMRGYMMNVAIHIWIRNAPVPDEAMKAYVRYFTGSDYWYMCLDAGKVESLFADLTRTVWERKLQREMPYSLVYDYLVQHDLASPAFK